MRIAQLSGPLDYGQPHFLSALIKAKNEAQVEELFLMPDRTTIGMTRRLMLYFHLQ